jgi:hypothetical protein
MQQAGVCSVCWCCCVSERGSGGQELVHRTRHAGLLHVPTFEPLRCAAFGRGGGARADAQGR